MSEKTRTLVESLRLRLHKTVRRMALADLAFGALLVLGLAAAVWLISVSVEAGFWLGVAARSVMFWTMVAAGVALLIAGIIIPGLRLLGVLSGPSEKLAARRIGDRFPEVSDRLVNLLDLIDGRSSEAPDEILDGAVRMLGDEIEPVPFERVEDFDRARRAARFVTVPVLALLVFLIAAPGTFINASQRLLSPRTSFERPAPFNLVVEPGSVELPRGADLDVRVRAEGRRAPEQVTVRIGNLGEEHLESITIQRDSAGTFSHNVINVRQSLRYRVAAAGVESAWYTASVTERPLVRGLQVTLNSPSYTALPPQRLEPNVGDVSALPGTRVSIDVGIGGQHVRQALLRFDDGSRDTLSLDGPSARGSFTLRRGGSYSVVLVNEKGLENTDPITYSLELIEDAHPSAIFLAPEADAVLSDAMQVAVKTRLQDDFGFSRVELFYRLAESRFGDPMTSFASIPLSLEDVSQRDVEHLHLWRINRETDLDPVPGDLIEYYVQVWDNDAVAGFKTARTAAQRLRLPSLAEQYERAEQEQDAAQQQLEEVLRETDQMREQFEGLRDELRRKQEADWEDERQLEQLQQQQEALEQQVDQVAEQMRSTAEQMRQNSLVSPETAELFEELNNVIEEINSPELMEALRELQEAVSELDLQKMQESMQDFEFNEDQYKQRLERSLELFKKLRMQQKLDEAARLAEELARRQERLQEETEKLKEQSRDDRAPQEDAGQREPSEEDAESIDEPAESEGTEPSDQAPEEGSSPEADDERRDEDSRSPGDSERRAEELAQEQKQAGESMEALEEKLEEAVQQMQESRTGPSEEMQQLQEQTKAQQLPQQMQQNSEQLQKMQLDAAQQGQQQLQQQLQQLQQQLQQMQAGMQSQQNQVNLSGLRRALGDVLTLSQDQEDLRTEVQANASDDTSLREDAKHQVELAEALSVVSDSLQGLARKIPQMSREVQRHTGEALRAMGQATEAMSTRAVGATSGHQRTSMMHLNELALMLTNLMDQLMNSQGGGSGTSMQQMQQQMQQMAKDQRQLNEQIQQFLNDVQGNRLSSDMQRRLQQMRQQQEAIQRQLREVNRNPEARGKLLGDLNKIAEQMEETIQELQRRHVDRRTVERQQQILTRLLDAQRSIQQRGREKQREGRGGEDVIREGPGDLPPQEQIDRLRRDLMRALESGYAPDYEELIKRYFELLQQQENGTD